MNEIIRSCLVTGEFLGFQTVRREQSRNLILGFEKVLRTVDGHMVGDCLPLKHLFTPGIYAREILLPQGVILTGKIHRHRHLNFISYGHVRMFTEVGGVEELRGPLTLISEPGTKRAIKVLEETVWTTIHHNPTDERDLEVLEEMIIAPSFETYDQEMLQALMKELT